MTFTDFWMVYPKKVAKRDAEKAWEDLSITDRQSAVNAVPGHVDYWERLSTERQFIPHPATWLRGARWEDDLQIDQPRVSEHEFFRMNGYRRPREQAS